MTEVISPEEFFGFQLGSDRKIARWDKIVEYIYKLQEQSDKIKVVDMGPSTEGNPFLLCIISSPENLENLEEYRKINNQLADPGDMTEEEAKELIGKGKAVICQSMSLHATEIGGTQMAPELAYDLLSKDDEETKRILDNVILLMVPCFNPDGQIMVTDWYNRWVGTEYEGTGLPYLYHKYVGHDNNRDAFQTNTVESKYMAKIMFQDWTPQHYVDHHHMGSYGARLYVPPYVDPIHPHADPLIWREHSWYGAHMAYRLEEEGKTGIINGAQFLAWGHLGFHWITIYHNIAGTLTESASARLASPLYIHPSQLRAGSRGIASYDPQTNFPHPWPGGWWRLRDIVEQQKISAWAAVDMAARNKDIALKNAYLKGKRQTERGACGTPAAYVVPAKQHDPVTAAKMVDKILTQGIKVSRATEDFIVDNTLYGAGSYIVDCAQPKSGLVKTLLGRTYYPDNQHSRDRDGAPLRPQDSATDTMFEYMGVTVNPVDYVACDMETVEEATYPEGCVVSTSEYGYALDPRINDSFTAVVKLQGLGYKVSRAECAVTCDEAYLPPGAFIVKDAKVADLEVLAKELNLTVYPLCEDIGDTVDVKPPKIGMYQRYYGGNMDEGWTRLMLEQFSIPYKTIMDDVVKKGDLKQSLDTIILPNDSETMIMGGDLAEYYKKRYGGRMSPPTYPPEYRSGIGDEGVEALKKFVNEGGTLVCFGGACEFAINKMDLKVTNVLKDVPSKEFFCPGSTLHANVDSNHPAAYGMPEDSLILFWNSLAFNIVPSGDNDKYDVVASFPERDIMESGWLIGEEKLKRKAAMVVAHVGEGKVVLIGFRPQNRAQTHGTYKLIFNSLFG